MFEIKRIDKKNIQEVKTFLDIPTIKEIDEKILKNGFVLYVDEIINAVISYEKIKNYALVRYFLFKRSLDKTYLKELLNTLEEHLVQKNLEYIITIINNNELFDLYKILGFKLSEKENEQFLKKYKSKNNIIMSKEIFVDKVPNKCAYN